MSAFPITPDPFPADGARLMAGVSLRIEPPPRAVAVDAVDGLIDRARTLGDLEKHGMHLLAARRWRSLNRPLPDRVLAQQMVAAISLAAPAVLARIRAPTGGPLPVTRPKVAVAYLHPVLRP